MGEFHCILGSRLVHERLVDLAAGDHRAHGDGTVGDLLGDAHQVRSHAEAVSAEHRAGTTEAGDHLVEHQQDAVLVADFAQALEVALRRHQHTGGTGHGLDEHRSNVRGIMQLDQFEQFLGQGNTALLRHATGEGVAGQQGMGQVIDIVHRLAKQLAVTTHTTEAGTGDIHPVIATGTADHLGLGRLPFSRQ